MKNSFLFTVKLFVKSKLSNWTIFYLYIVRWDYWTDNLHHNHPLHNRNHLYYWHRFRWLYTCESLLYIRQRLKKKKLCCTIYLAWCFKTVFGNPKNFWRCSKYSISEEVYKKRLWNLKSLPMSYFLFSTIWAFNLFSRGGC